MKQNTIVTLADMKARGEKISQLTCYDYSTARLMDQAGINMILVGDSLGMTMQGYSDTIPVTMEEMIDFCTPMMVRANPELPPEQARAQMAQFFPSLLRWRN